MKKKKNLKLRDVRPTADPKAGRHHHHKGSGNRPERPEPPLTPGGIIP